MNENLDLTKILKDCPKGTEFYSSYLGKNVIFIEIYDNHIKCEYFSQIDSLNCSIQFKKDGSLYPGGDCMLFPSKDQRDWSKWQRPFVDGDIVYYDKFVSIFKKWGDETLFYSHISIEVNSGEIKDRCFGKFIRKESRSATENEKQRLFDAIKENGYKWDAEKKELKKIEPKFDISTLQPFDKVLVRDGDGNPWGISLFSHLKESDYLRFSCVNLAPWRQCVPYNDDTKHLVGKRDNAPGFYRYWEE